MHPSPRHSPAVDARLQDAIARIGQLPVLDRSLRRVRERFAWSAVAHATAGQYLAAMEGLATTKGQARKDRPSADR